MEELRYQVDLLRAMNQKLMNEEKMLRLICNTSNGAFLYVNFEEDIIKTLANWDFFFPEVEIRDKKDMAKLYSQVEDTYVLPLRDLLFLEKTGLSSDSGVIRLKDGKTWVECEASVVYDNDRKPVDKVIRFKNISKFKNQNDELTYMAYYDVLTGLYNRNYFVRLLADFVRKAEENNAVVAVMFVDIDDFRKINDGLGLIVGDELVQQMGQFLATFNSDNVVVSHFNADIYCIAVYEPCGNRSVEHIYKTIQERCHSPFVISTGQELTVSVCVGVAEYPEVAKTTLELINCAEIVMFKAKDSGKNGIQYFNAPILNDFLQNVTIENKLKEAIFNQNFTMNFQPQYHVADKKLRGVEALIRWRDTDGKMISPSVFIPIAEKNGTIVPIGTWVMEESIKCFAEWKRNYASHMILSLNISAIQYKRNEFVESILSIIRKYDVNPEEIELEITESVLIDNFREITEKLCLLREYGIRISLDDFGTGYSSLSYLKGLPIDTLKIDKSFIDTMLTDQNARIITESIIYMVKKLGYETVAEGVENKEQFDYLKSIGCDCIQGFLLGKPLPADKIEELFGWYGVKRMILGRASELNYLNTCYQRKNSQILVLYGEKNVGKTALLKRFAEEKSCCYYRARSASLKEQRFQFGRELSPSFLSNEEAPSYTALFRLTDKDILIVDEFQYIVKSDGDFIGELIEHVKEREEKEQPVMVILCSSSISWVENSMIKRIGTAAYEISGFLKVKELGFEAMVEYFPGFQVEECIEAYAVLGGVPGLWKYFDDRLTIRENICRHILTEGQPLFDEGQHIVEEELRETGVYNTILASIAAGNQKLNDLYLHTGFSRAKISVYLKNLMELELMEKVFSCDTEGKANVQKGLYRIKNHFVDFYFTFLYPNLSAFFTMTAEEFYDSFIAPYLKGYVEEYYKTVCTQRMEQWNRQGMLPFSAEYFGEWAGKFGNIDIVAQSEEGETIIALCNFEKPMMRYDDYEWLLFCAEKAKLKADYVYLFSVGRFDEKLSLEARVKQNLKLITLDEM